MVLGSIARTALLVAVAAAAACAPQASLEDLRRLDETVNALRAQLAHESARVEELSHDILVLSERQSAAPSTPSELTRAEPSVPPELKVIHLTPPKDAATVSHEAPVTLSLGASPEGEPLRLTSVPPAPTAKVADEANSLLTRGLDLYQQADFAAARTQFRVFVERFARHVDADKAYYWLGECSLEQHDYAPAIEAFMTVLTQFPRSSKRADAMLNAGLAYQHLNQAGEARRMFAQLVSAYPHTALADLARTRLENADQGGLQ